MKKKSHILAIAVCIAAVLSTTAFAYYADVTASHSVILTGLMGYSTIEANSSSGLTQMCAQAAIYDDNDNEYGFDNDTLNNPTVSRLRVSAYAQRSRLTNGNRYHVAAYGHIKYMTKYGEEIDRYTDQDYFTYWRNSATSSTERIASNDKILKNNYNQMRANYIFEKFDMNPSDYSYACNFDLMNYVEIEEYNFIRESMNITEGTTTPSFYVGDGVIFGVSQDANAVNYLFEFSATGEKNWELHNKKQFQDIGRYHDIYQSFSDYLEASTKLETE